MIRALRPRYPSLPVWRMCQLLGVPRSLAYRAPAERPASWEGLVAEIEGVLESNPGNGYRRVRRELAKRGVECGYKAVARAMREAGLQPRRKRPHPRTSDGRGRGNYPNLLKDAAIAAPGQAWVADIAYVAVPGGFAYEACLLDVFLRKAVGRAMSGRIDSALTLTALRDALSKSPPPNGWIHHSDRGSQYLCDEYVRTVQAAGGRVSCSDRGTPQDNAFMESFFKTLKSEEVWLEDYESLEHAERSVRRFVDYYNRERMHSSLGYLSPEQYEASLQENDPS